MTTIACDRKVMVSDSKVTVEHKGFDYPAIKIIKVNGIMLGAAGDSADCTKFLKWGATGFSISKEPKWSSETLNGAEDATVGLLLKEDGIYIWSYGDPEPEKVEAEFFAIGSGGKAARVAMIMGKTPEEAVELACQVDPYSGPPLQILKL